MANIFKTGLYPVFIQTADSDSSIKLFYVKSNCIKIYPASWRGGEVQTDTDVIPPTDTPEGSIDTTTNGTFESTTKALFNVEAVLNTEFNITNTPGHKDLITFYEKNSETGLITIKFFINGYAVELYNLDFSNIPGINPDTVNLYASLRTISQTIGEDEDGNVDTTQVLAPYADTSVVAPIPLDQHIFSFYVGQAAEGSGSAANSLSNEDLLKPESPYHYPTYGSPFKDNDQEGIQAAIDPSTDYLFTGIVFAFSMEAFSDAAQQLGSASAASIWYPAIQLINNGKENRDLRLPQIHCGEDGAQTAVVLGDNNGIISPINNMVAIGHFNTVTNIASSNTTPGEYTLLSVGAGADEEHRRNAFEVTADTLIDTGTEYFETNIRSGTFRVKTATNTPHGSEVSGVHTINKGLQLANDGSHLIINAPDKDNNIVKNSNVGLDVYGNMNLIESSFHFKDRLNNTNETKTVATFSTGDLAGDLGVSDRCLNLVGIGDINHSAVTFKLGTITGGHRLHRINDNIEVQPSGKQLTINTGKSTLVIGSDNGNDDGNAIINGITNMSNGSEPTTINNLTITNSTDTELINTNLPLKVQTTANKIWLNTGAKGQVQLFSDHPVTIGINNNAVADITLPASASNGSKIFGVDQIARSTNSADATFTLTNNTTELKRTSDSYVKLAKAETKIAHTANSTINLSDNKIEIKPNGGNITLDGATTISKATVLEDALTVKKGVTITGETSITTSNKGSFTVKAATSANKVDAKVTGNLEVTGTCKFTNLDLSENKLTGAIIDLIYPVGSIYMTMTPGSPENLWPTTKWKKIAGGRVLVGQSTEESWAYAQAAGNTGGSAQAVLKAHTHTITAKSAITADSIAKVLSAEADGSHTHTVNEGGAHWHTVKCTRVAGAGTKDGEGDYNGVEGNNGKQKDWFGTGRMENNGNNDDQGHTGRPEGPHSHTMAEGGSHTHTIKSNGEEIDATISVTAESAGQTFAGTENLPPYLVCYIWQRMSNDWNRED
jgi:hypothetical protein